jgi:tight adherence protein C
MTIQLLIFAAIVFLPVAVISFVALRRAWEPGEHALERLNRPGPELLPAPASETNLGGLTAPLAGLLPSTQDGRAAIYQELRAAGYYRPNALTEYLAFRNLLVLLALLVAGGLCLILEPQAIPIIALGGLVATILGFSVPRLYIQMRGTQRYQQILRGLPTAVDMLALALTAGLNLFAALKRVAVELRHTYPVLAQEFDITHRQAELRSLEHALDQLADRVRLPEMRNLAIILAQSERTGSDATAVLLETSNNMRTSMRQRAETQANRMSLWILFPSVGCFLVSAALLIAGPVFLELRNQIETNRQGLQEGLQRLPGRVPRPAPAPPAVQP